MSTSLIQMKDLEKSYRLAGEDVHVLKKINLSINQGEFVSIMGTSGSGKSTLMNIIGFLDRPSHGLYHFKNKDVTALTDDDESLIRNLEIGFIYQNYNLLPRCSAFENIALPLFYRHDNEAVEEKVMKALSIVGLTDRKRNKPNELSGGQRQRVAIARAIVGNPSILLADEPTGALDSKTGKEILELFGKLHQSGCTIIMVTHDRHVADHSKRIIHIKDGLIVEETHK